MQAIRTAGGPDFCIATTGHASGQENDGTIGSRFDLRGTNLYTSRKATPPAQINAVGVYRYWSIRLQRFVPYDGESRFPVVSSRDACAPRLYFLFTL